MSDLFVRRCEPANLLNLPVPLVRFEAHGAARDVIDHIERVIGQASGKQGRFDHARQLVIVLDRLHERVAGHLAIVRLKRLGAQTQGAADRLAQAGESAVLKQILVADLDAVQTPALRGQPVIFKAAQLAQGELSRLAKNVAGIDPDRAALGLDRLLPGQVTDVQLKKPDITAIRPL